MKTTLDIDDDLYRQAKVAAAMSGKRVKDIVNEGLRLALKQPTRKAPKMLVLGCLKHELSGQSISEIMDDLRGTTKERAKKKSSPTT